MPCSAASRKSQPSIDRSYPLLRRSHPDIHPYSPLPGDAGVTVGARSEREKERELADMALRLTSKALLRLREGLALAAASAEGWREVPASQWQARGRGLPLTPFEAELLSCLKSNVVTPLE